MMILLFILSFLLNFQDILSTGFIEESDCDSKMSIDQALIQFQTNKDVSLFATSHICYKCSRTYVAENNQCALLFTPHPFRLYIVESNTTSVVISKRDYTFGEHGIYTISYGIDNENPNKIIIKEEKQPVDTYKPLISLLIVIFTLTFFVFLPTMSKFIIVIIIHQLLLLLFVIMNLI